VEGKRMQVGLAFEQRGCGSAPHRHPNEQFNLILQGSVRVKIGDLDEMIVPKGSVVYFPANIVHSQVALPDEDVIFYVVKDLTHGIVGIPAGSGKAGKSRPNRKHRRP
jgi:quercetin dioxygenase-like cupin family protein